MRSPNWLSISLLAVACPLVIALGACRTEDHGSRACAIDTTQAIQATHQNDRARWQQSGLKPQQYDSLAIANCYTVPK